MISSPFIVLSTSSLSALSVLEALNFPGLTLAFPIPRFQRINGRGFPSSLEHLNTVVVPSLTADSGNSVATNVVAPTNKMRKYTHKLLVLLKGTPFLCKE